MNGETLTPQNEQPIQNPSPISQSETPKEKKGLLKTLVFLEVGIIEVVFVGVVITLLFGALNYFNILSISTLWPNQFGFLPHQKQKNSNITIVPAVSPTLQAKETLTGTLPNILIPALIPQEKGSIEEIIAGMSEPPQLGLSFSGTMPLGEKKATYNPIRRWY